jgi:hypothetical protein
MGVEQVGQVLTASDLRSVRAFWHVKKNKRIKIYASVYKQHAVGMLLQMMAQFQTWFEADKCTDYVLDPIAGRYASCRQRMNFLVQDRM